MTRQPRLNPSPRPRWSFDDGNGRGRTRPVIRSRTTAEDVLRREALASAGVADRGQSLTDAAQLARGTRATPLSRDLATLQAGNKPAVWFPGGVEAGGPGIISPSMRTSAAAAAARAEDAAKHESWLTNPGGGAGNNAPFRGSTPNEIAAFQAGGAGDDAAVKGVAMTGKTLQTPYGPVASRGRSWQEELVSEHPALGIKGSQANADFVTAFKATGGADPKGIAKQVFANIEKGPEPVVKPAADIAGTGPAYSTAPLSLGNDRATAIAGNLGGSPKTPYSGAFDAPTEPVNDWLVPDPPTPGAIAGANLRSRASDLMNEPDSPASIAKNVVSAGGSAMGAARGALAAVGDFGKALFGDSSPRPSATQPLAQTSSPSMGRPMDPAPSTSPVDDATRFPLTAPKPGPLALGQGNQTWFAKPPTFAPPGTKPDAEEEKRKRQLAGTSY